MNRTLTFLYLAYFLALPMQASGCPYAFNDRSGSYDFSAQRQVKTPHDIVAAADARGLEIIIIPTSMRPHQLVIIGAKDGDLHDINYSLALMRDSFGLELGLDTNSPESGIVDETMHLPLESAKFFPPVKASDLKLRVFLNRTILEGIKTQVDAKLADFGTAMQTVSIYANGDTQEAEISIGSKQTEGAGGLPPITFTAEPGSREFEAVMALTGAKPPSEAGFEWKVEAQNALEAAINVRLLRVRNLIDFRHPLVGGSPAHLDGYAPREVLEETDVMHVEMLADIFELMNFQGSPDH